MAKGKTIFPEQIVVAKNVEFFVYSLQNEQIVHPYMQLYQGGLYLTLLCINTI